ncbi:hypothetical protein [Streptomyces xanthochromogenes]|uniref:hypothetical protein n=1 Tax=Streptomyces xanthochromogenes TaxID=67384 RepID=UPI0034270CCD
MRNTHRVLVTVALGAAALSLSGTAQAADPGPKRGGFHEFVVERGPDGVIEVEVVEALPVATGFVAPRRVTKVVDEEDLVDDRFVDEAEPFFEEEEAQRDVFVEELATSFFDSASDVTTDH